ncbi:Zinc knuckle containing protein [Rhynchospora pubera]|uniref:Zinc knuckle containing protein n=1 Tax=Rhynchospora pubera TaxID=906938 RepID=A0AAV8CA06_9POAL|nr:Zinc knuckle containing protein [Rhynchospora pubera]
MIFLRHHLHEDLKNEYLTVKKPLELWKSLKERFDHQKYVLLPKARYEWIHLRLQDYKFVAEYNSAMFRITSELKLCGEPIKEEDMLEKTFSTFHASNLLLQQQYRERGFKKYSELVSCLLVAEQNNELLMKNHQARPTGSTPFPEANAISSNRGRGRGRKNFYGRGRGRGRGCSYTWRRDGQNNKPNENNMVKNDKAKRHENICYRCGMTNHWSRTCRTPKHLVLLYQASIKKKEKNLEVNLAENNHENGFQTDTHLDVSDFFNNVDEEISAMKEN